MKHLIEADLELLDADGEAWLIGWRADLEEDLARLEAFDAYCFARDRAIGAA